MKECSFMKDESENNHGYEYILDFQMSWVMRVAASNEMKENNALLHKYCSTILKKLIEKSDKDNVEILEVRVWKQWKRIDLHANIIIRINGKEEKHLVVIENKAYTMIHDDQLNRYEISINKVYDNDNCLKEFKKHFWVITFFDPDNDRDNYKKTEMMCEASNAKWKLLSFEDLLNDNPLPTGNDQFDDFWIYPWP